MKLPFLLPDFTTSEGARPHAPPRCPLPALWCSMGFSSWVFRSIPSGNTDLRTAAADPVHGMNIAAESGREGGIWETRPITRSQCWAGL